MSSKISALPVATVAFANTDVICALQGATNVKLTKPVLLTAAAAEPIAMNGQLSQIGIDFQGGIGIVGNGGFNVLVSNGLNFFLCDSFGNADMGTTAGGSQVRLLGNFGCTIVISGIGHILLTDTSGLSVFATYVSPFPADWAVAPPVDIATAIDRIARVLAILSGAPIP